MGLDIVELFLAVEERFDITIPDAEAEQIRTVGQMLEAILARRPSGYRVRTTTRILGLAEDPIVYGGREMTREEVWSALVDIVVDQLGVERSAVTPEARWVDDLGAD